MARKPHPCFPEISEIKKVARLRTLAAPGCSQPATCAPRPLCGLGEWEPGRNLKRDAEGVGAGPHPIKQGRKIVCCVFALLLFSLCFVSGDASAQSLTVTPRAVELGDVTVKSKNTIRLVCRNEGTAPLVIRDIAVDCKCTKPTWSRKPLMPGDSTVVTVVFTPTDTGGFYKSLRFETSPPAPQPIEATIRGRVVKNNP